jgi:hypothetical protein
LLKYFVYFFEKFAKLIDHLALRDSALTGKIEAVNGSVFTARVKLLDKLEKKGFEVIYLIFICLIFSTVIVLIILFPVCASPQHLSRQSARFSEGDRGDHGKQLPFGIGFLVCFGKRTKGSRSKGNKYRFVRNFFFDCLTVFIFSHLCLS